jgi:dihydrofolate synthase/folylpolyglutamate synthase
VNYRQAEEYLRSFIDYEKIPGIPYASGSYSLKHIEEILHSMSDPHLAAKTIHIAGTKGKGSTAAMIAEVLSLSGYKTGLYTSPHLHTLRERIRVDGDLISQAQLAAVAAKIKPYFGAMNHRLTFFEALTILAFSYFKEEEVSFQVLEAGLGGRLDATNVTKPEVCVITPISLDHTEVLGDSLAKIAYEKASIIKPGCAVISSPQPEEASTVIAELCHRKGARLIQVGKDISYHKLGADLYHQLLVVNGQRSSYHLSLALLGDFQLENATAAVAVLEVLASQGYRISPEDISRGLVQVKWPGRFQILHRAPMVLADGAHNVASMKRLLENIKEYFNYKSLFLIIGISADKDIIGIIRELVSFSPQVMVTRSRHPRATFPSVLAAEFAKQGIRAQTAASVSEALSQTLSQASDKDLICVTGSLFVVAEAQDYFDQRSD